jgi:hypothetical protein
LLTSSVLGATRVAVKVERDPTCIGRVRHVLGATVTVELDPALAGVAPLWEGRLQPIGQVGSLVRLPQGPVTLLATVTLVGIAELTGPLAPSTIAEIGNRWLQVQLLGEVDGLGVFHRGVSTYPGLDDPVHFATPVQLAAVYPAADDTRVVLGTLAAAPEVPLTLDAGRLVTRHCAVVGSTGSGKSSAIATLLQGFISGGWTDANIVIIDPHGEYAAAFAEHAAVRSVLGAKDDLLRVPFWALPSDDILQAFCGPVESATPRSRFTELVTAKRQEFAARARWLPNDPATVSADSPVPFDLRSVWYQLDYDNRATYEKPNSGGDIAEIHAGASETLQPAQFQNYGVGNQAPFKGSTYGYYGLVPDRLRRRLGDSRFGFFLEPAGDPDGDDPLPQVLDAWLGGNDPVSVLDFSGVPAEVADLAIGVVLHLLFEVAVRSRDNGIGRARPVLVVLEEAHRYLSDHAGTAHVARNAANRIAREGRKYGMGLVLVTQRPSELPATTLAQIGTIVAMRLTNGTDQGMVKAALPDSVAGLANVLPALRTGEAIVVGEAVELPTRVLIDRPNPAPTADDPSLEPWRRPAGPNDLADAVARWRGAGGT